MLSPPADSRDVRISEEASDASFASSFASATAAWSEHDPPWRSMIMSVPRDLRFARSSLAFVNASFAGVGLSETSLDTGVPLSLSKYVKNMACRSARL